MSAAAWTTLGLLVALFGFLIWNKLPIWLVFLGAITIAITLKLAPAAALLKGYSNSGVVTVAALYPVAAGMYATGAISLVSERLIGLPKSITVAQVRILTPVAVASAFLYNTPLVAMMIPAVRDVARLTGLKSSKLFMGISFVALLGGTITLIGTAVNLIVAGMVSEAVANGEIISSSPIRMFDPMWIGIPATLGGLLFLILAAPRLLPDREDDHAAVEKRRYRSEFFIEASSRLERKTLEQVGFAKPVGYVLDSVRRNGQLLEIEPQLTLEAGDLLTFIAPADVLPGLWTTVGLVPAYATKMQSRRHEHQLVEVVLSAKSPTVGHKVSDLPLPDSPYGLMLVGVSRNGEAMPDCLEDLRLQPGDAGVMEVDDAFFYENRRESDFLLTKRLEGFRVQRVDRAIVALVITMLMVTLAATGIFSMLNAALLAAMAMLVTGCLTIDRLWQSIDWKTIVVIGTSVGLETAVTGTGLANKAAEGFALIGGGSPRIALAVVFFGTVALTNVMSNVASAVLMFSVAVSLAHSLGVNFLPFAMVLMSAASCAFINPAAFQTNVMVQQPGGYRFSDFARVGIPLTVLVGIIVLWLAPIMYGF